MKTIRTMTIFRTVEITDEDIMDIMCSAIEGGIGYWACLDNSGKEWANDNPASETAAKILLDGGTVRFLDDEDRETEYLLTLDKLCNGIQKYITESPEILDDNSHIECGEVDAIVADMMVQYAIFGEVMFS